MLGEYDARTLADRSALQAQMLQSGFQNAQQAAANAFTQGGQLAAAQSGLGAAQMGLSNFQRAGLGADVGALGQLGSLRQGQEQSLLSPAKSLAAPPPPLIFFTAEANLGLLAFNNVPVLPALIAFSASSLPTKHTQHLSLIHISEPTRPY